MKKLFAIAALGLAALSLNARAARAEDIVDIAAANPQFSTLVSLVKAAGLVDTLKSDGPFTVFAPTNAAFKKVPHATLEMLGKPENIEKLKKVLTYHVVSGKVLAADVLKLKNKTAVKSVEGSSITVGISKKGVTVDKAKVVKTDILASNGVIHVIDAVIIPKDL